MSISIVTAEERRAKWIFDKTINLHEGEQQNNTRPEHNWLAPLYSSLARLVGSKVQLANKQFRATKEALLNTFLTSILERNKTSLWVFLIPCISRDQRANTEMERRDACQHRLHKLQGKYFIVKSFIKEGIKYMKILDLSFVLLNTLIALEHLMYICSLFCLSQFFSSEIRISIHN